MGATDQVARHQESPAKETACQWQEIITTLSPTSTVAILAQGTHRAVATPQAFFQQARATERKMRERGDSKREFDTV